MNSLVDGWNKHMLQRIASDAPELIRKHRGSISGSIALLVLYLGYRKVTQVPRKLRHIPHVGFWTVILAHFAGKPTDEFYEESILPVAKNSEHGLYTRFYKTSGWTVHIARPEAAKTFLYKADLFVRVKIGERLKGTLVEKLAIGPSIVYLSGNPWKHQRMIVGPIFHRSMPVNTMGNVTTKLFERIDSQGGLVDFQDMMRLYTLDILGKTVMGYDFNSLEIEGNEMVHIYDSITTAFRHPLYLIFPILDTKLRFLFPKRQKQHQQATQFLSKINELIRNKRKILKEHKTLDLKDEEKDLITLLLEAENEGGPTLTDEEITNNVCNFFIGGHESTAGAMSLECYYLAVNPDIQKKAREEVIQVLGDDPRDVFPTAEQLKKMRYINNVIKEALRIRTPLASLIPRIATEDTELAGVLIPKGTPVNLDIYAIQHNPSLWKDPEVFDPDRFAPGGEAERCGLSWIPFSSGKHQCLAMNFSLAEQRVLMAMLCEFRAFRDLVKTYMEINNLIVRKYEFSLPENSIHKDKAVLLSYNVLMTKTLHMTFKKRY